MTPSQIETVKDSYFRIYPVREKIAQSYFAELFRIAPSVRSRLPDNINDQSRKLADIVGYLIMNLQDMPTLEMIVARMAQKHLDYGVRPEHFAPIGAAFLNALAQNMPSELSRDESDAWMAAFGMITDMMTDEMLAQSRAA